MSWRPGSASIALENILVGGRLQSCAYLGTWVVNLSNEINGWRRFGSDRYQPPGPARHLAAEPWRTFLFAVLHDMTLRVGDFDSLVSFPSLLNTRLHRAHFRSLLPLERSHAPTCSLCTRSEPEHHLARTILHVLSLSSSKHPFNLQHSILHSHTSYFKLFLTHPTHLHLHLQLLAESPRPHVYLHTEYIPNILHYYIQAQSQQTLQPSLVPPELPRALLPSSSYRQTLAFACTARLHT